MSYDILVLCNNMYRCIRCYVRVSVRVYLGVYTVNATLTQDKLSDAFLYYGNKVGDDFIKTTCFYHKNTNVYTNLFNIEMC